MNTTYIGARVIECLARDIGNVNRHERTIWLEVRPGRADSGRKDREYGGSKSGGAAEVSLSSLNDSEDTRIAEKAYRTPTG
jgi:hypothetical protein